MSTISQNPLTQSPQTRQLRTLLPAIETLAARDFKVCENCGGPAMLHPRFEMAQMVSGEKAVLCCACLHESAFPAPPPRLPGEHRTGDQLWSCVECFGIRVWGWMQPFDSKLRPALHCADCERVTRHRFVRVA